MKKIYFILFIALIIFSNLFGQAVEFCHWVDTSNCSGVKQIFSGEQIICNGCHDTLFPDALYNVYCKEYECGTFDKWSGEANFSACTAVTKCRK